MGYLPTADGDRFEATTFVAVTLCQIASGQTPTGEADEALLSALREGDVPPLAEAGEALRASLDAMGAQELLQVAAVAGELPGRAFDGGDDPASPGFAFAQYAYARAGAGLTEPGRVYEEALAQENDATMLTGGEVVLLQRSDGSLLFTISLGGTRVAYADAATGFVVSGDLSSMEYVSIYVWRPSAL